MGDVQVRPVRPGDGPGCARAWVDAGRHYAAIDSEQFQLPTEDGLVDWFERLHANLAPDRLVLVACVYRSKMSWWCLTCGFMELFTRPGDTR